MKKLIVRKSQEKRGPGYQLQIHDNSVSLQDLIDGLDEYIVSGNAPRLWPEQLDACRGCHLCCHEPLPLTSIDVGRICKATGTYFTGVFRYLQVEIQGRSVDITLKRPGGDCIFLSKQGTCKIYHDRPFLCHVYICCHVQEAVQEIYSEVVNQGMDELVRQALAAFAREGKQLPARRGSCRQVRPGDWRPNCFTGKQDYSQLFMKDVLSSALQKVLLV
ncbi:MAG TPA: YkgJ family cysteine cluster protein [Syntrophomonadaceae bacterium]|nr:YkgJ family cysteine cluster protein [Syntrophomonadaceae bacterium]